MNSETAVRQFEVRGLRGNVQKAIGTFVRSEAELVRLHERIHESCESLRRDGFQVEEVVEILTIPEHHSG